MLDIKKRPEGRGNGGLNKQTHSPNSNTKVANALRRGECHAGESRFPGTLPTETPFFLGGRDDEWGRVGVRFDTGIPRAKPGATLCTNIKFGVCFETHKFGV